VSGAHVAEKAIVESHGGRMASVGLHPEGGETWPEYFVVTPGGNEGALVILNALARHDARTSRRVQAIAQAAGAGHFPPRRVATEIQRLVQRSVNDVDDPFQVFRPSDLTLLRRAGNCVNSARVVMASALAAGLPARCVPVYIGGELRHTCAQVRIDGVWTWAEATITANLGEPPLAAVARGAERTAYQQGVSS
jgi:transglutaminase-like putative cysteine protease